jgi:uncharacterized membrane protein YkvA (DUF1232 family)
MVYVTGEDVANLTKGDASEEHIDVIGSGAAGPRPRGVRRLVESWKQRAASLKVELHAIYLAYKHPGVPWHARLFAGVVIAYALSPIDLIPDPIPVLGYLDDLVLIPLGLALAIKMIPKEVMAECRERAQEAGAQWRPMSWTGAVIVVALWILLAAAGVALIARWMRH